MLPARNVLLTCWYEKKGERKKKDDCSLRKIFSAYRVESEKCVHVMSRQINETIKVRGEEE